jgi:hypothetical protein
MKKFQITNSKLQTIYNIQIPNYKKSSQELFGRSSLVFAPEAYKSSLELFGILIIVICNFFVICYL